MFLRNNNQIPTYRKLSLKWFEWLEYWESNELRSGGIPLGPRGRLVFSIRSVKDKSVAQSCPTLCDPMDCSPPGSSVHGIFQARILEWVAISFSRGFSWPRDWTQASSVAGRRFTIWATKEAQVFSKLYGNSVRLYFSGSQNHYRWWLQPWN